MESKMYGFLEKMIVFRCFWVQRTAWTTSEWRAKCVDFRECDGQRAFAKMILKLDLSMESKMYGYLGGHDRCQVSVGATDSADSQK